MMATRDLFGSSEAQRRSQNPGIGQPIGPYGSSLSPELFLELQSRSYAARAQARLEADAEHLLQLVDGQLVASTLEDLVISPDLSSPRDGLSGGTFCYAHGPRPA